MPEAVAKAADESEDLYNSEAVLAEFKRVFRAYSRDAAAHEKIRDFRLIEEPFTVDNGLMTPTLKLKRTKILERYKDKIARMYEGHAVYK